MKAGFNKNRYRNFFIGITISCALTLFAFNYKTEYNIGDIVEITPDENIYGVQVISVSFPPPEIPKEKKRRVKPEPFTIDAKIKIVQHEILKPTPIAVAVPIAVPVSTPTLAPSAPTTDVKDWVEVKPSFPGGPDALNRFLRKNLKYPDDCEELEREGTVRVMFIVDEEGRITEIKVLDNELLPSAGNESHRVIGMMPQWTPGMIGGKAVKTYFIQPIRFRLY
ncbi:MAG: protein TonB [bacterium]|jgi:protein TonB